MAVVTTYRAGTKYVRAAVDVTRFVRKDAVGAGYSWCLRDNRTGRDIKQGACAAADLHEGVRGAADAWRGHAFGYVEWPPHA